MGRHALEMLTAAEVEAAVAAVRPRLTDAARFGSVHLQEPARGAPDDGVRRVRLVIVPGPEASVVEAVVAVPAGVVEAWVERADVRPALLFEESFTAIIALHESEEWKAALARRGITDLDTVQVDPWPTGSFDIEVEEGRRVARCIPYLRATPEANGYARPIEGLLARVDMARGEVLEVRDFMTAPIPADPGSYYAEDVGPAREVAALDIVQPDGPGFTVEGNLVTWQGWEVRVTLDPLEGLVLHQLSIAGRSVLHRAAISEMVVPYGDLSPEHSWKNAFDVGEWGLGRMANSLELGCDCLGEIRYLSTVTADEHGGVVERENVICLHEEDVGILWKHHDMHSGRTEVRRSRRMVISSIATVGNYEYGFYWYLSQDGTIELDVKLTGVLSTAARDWSVESPLPGTLRKLAPGLAAPVHQHLFCARLDLAVDGGPNEVHRVEVGPMAGGGGPLGNGMAVVDRVLETEQDAIDVVDAARSRTWRVVNPEVCNQLGDPVAYKLLPGAVPTLLATPESSVGRRAGFASANVWVTPYDPSERRAAGDFPNQHPGGDGLPAWTAADRPLVGGDGHLVLWHTFGVTHVPRPEDWPVMPVEHTGFSLVPVGFFDRNPALDVPPPGGAHCH